MRKTIALALCALVALLALLWHAIGDSSAPTETTETTARVEQSAPAPRTPAAPPRSPASTAGASPGSSDGAMPAMPGEATKPDYPVDLEKLRRSMPDNLYWTLGAPTEDESVLRTRAERARATNELFGKVQSTTATEEEIDRYYADRRRVSEDYIAFAQRVLADHRAQLPQDHIGMYELSIQLNRARLAEIPRDRGEALARLRAKRKE